MTEFMGWALSLRWWEYLLIGYLIGYALSVQPTCEGVVRTVREAADGDMRLWVALKVAPGYAAWAVLGLSLAFAIFWPIVWPTLALAFREDRP